MNYVLMIVGIACLIAAYMLDTDDAMTRCQQTHSFDTCFTSIH